MKKTKKTLDIKYLKYYYQPMRLNKTEQIVFDAMARLNKWSTVKQITVESQTEKQSIQHQSVRRALITLESFKLIKRQDDPEYPSGWRKLYRV